MSDGVSEYWKNKTFLDEKNIRNMVTNAANATARILQRPDLDKSREFTLHGTKYRMKLGDVTLVPYNGGFTSGGPVEIETLGKFEVKE
jgi:hypothetical protein